MQTNVIINGDAFQQLKNLDIESVDLIVTSPPYNASKEYESKLSEQEYFDFIYPIVKEFARILKPDGRFCVNVCFNINRINVVGDSSQNTMLFPYLSWIEAIKKNGLILRENIVWDQSNSGCKTAWGSWRSASAPHIRHMTEYILVGYKSQWKKSNKGESDLTANEFTLWTLDKWRFGAETNRTLHPAPFPEELAKRCIKLFSYVGDVVLDPFDGGGTTCVVAKKFGRRYIGIDLSPEYTRIAQKRVANIPEKLELFISESKLLELKK
jgi:site-specific DNA-methyltransferase (adenine-specific)